MKLHFRKDKLRSQICDVLSQMLVAADKRESFYRKLRAYHYFGGEQDGQYATVNKIRPLTDTLRSILYSPSNTRWWIDIPLQDRHESLDAQISDGAMDYFNHEWDASKAAMKASMGLQAALIEGVSIMEWATHKKRVKLYRLPTAQFGVYREDCNDLSEQEAVVSQNYILTHELLRWAAQKGITGWEEKIKTLANEYSYQAEPKAQSTKEIMVTGWEQQGAPIRGYVAPTATDTDYTAQVNIPIIPVNKLWIWDDYYDDYRVFYIIGEGEILWDSGDPSVGGSRDFPNPFVRGRHPFWKIQPFPIESYVWGWSFVYQLVGAQAWWNNRLNQFDEAFSKSLKPPLRIKSSMELAQDQIDIFHSPGGFFRMSQPQDSIDPMYPQLPQAAFEGFKLIEESLKEMANLSPIVLGQGESGVRSNQQAASMMRASSSPLRQVALTVEDDLTEGGNLLWDYLRVNSSNRVFTKSGNHAILAQMSEGCEVKIDGHSCSPIFMEDHMQTAITLLKIGAIDQESFIDLIRPPLYGLIKSRLPALQRQQAQSAMMQAMMKKGSHK